MLPFSNCLLTNIIHLFLFIAKTTLIVFTKGQQFVSNLKLLLCNKRSTQPQFFRIYWTHTVSVRIVIVVVVHVAVVVDIHHVVRVVSRRGSEPQKTANSKQTDGARHLNNRALIYVNSP